MITLNWNESWGNNLFYLYSYYSAQITNDVKQPLADSFQKVVNSYRFNYSPNFYVFKSLSICKLNYWSKYCVTCIDRVPSFDPFPDPSRCLGAGNNIVRNGAGSKSFDPNQINQIGFMALLGDTVKDKLAYLRVFCDIIEVCIHLISVKLWWTCYNPMSSSYYCKRLAIYNHFCSLQSINI